MSLPVPAAIRRRPWLLLLAGAAVALVVVTSQRIGPLAPLVLEVTQPQQLAIQPVSSDTEN